jgi:tRNA U34 5-carboxymethylaminomethyl modifying GTPase MnmE/TrmE
LVNLYDTAGLRSSTNKIENEGMKRAKYLNWYSDWKWKKAR